MLDPNPRLSPFERRRSAEIIIRHPPNSRVPPLLPACERDERLRVQATGFVRERDRGAPVQRGFGEEVGGEGSGLVAVVEEEASRWRSGDADFGVFVCKGESESGGREGVRVDGQ